MSTSGYYQRMFNTVTEATDILNSVNAINVSGVPDASATVSYGALNMEDVTKYQLSSGDMYITSLGYGSSYCSLSEAIFGSNTVDPAIQQNGYPFFQTFNTGVGYRSLQSTMNPASINSIYPSNNVGVGVNSLQRLIGDSRYNTAIGSNALIISQSTLGNTAIGNLALLSLRDSSSINGGFNTAIGNNSLLFCASGTRNTTVGNMTLHAAVNASGCIALGKGAAQNPSFVSPDTIAIGCDALCEQISGQGRNIAIGYDSMCALKNGEDNIAVGSRSMFSCTSGSRNVMIGAYPENEGWVPYDYEFIKPKIYGITSGDDNVIIGSNSANVSGSIRNIVIGNDSFSPFIFSNSPLVAPNDNIIIGTYSARPKTNFNLRRNIFIGNNLYANQWEQGFEPGNDDNYITVIQNNGNTSYSMNVVVQNNTVFGAFSGVTNFFGGSNTIVGANSWVTRTGSPPSPYPDYGDSWNGNVNTVIGANVYVPGSANEINTTIMLGDDYIATLRCQVNLTVVSDARDKYIVGPLTVGLDFIEKLRPVTFTWNKRNKNASNPRESDKTVQTGVIAQEVLKVINDNKWDFFNIVDTTYEERYTINPEGFLPPISVSLKELKSELSDLHSRIDKLSQSV